MPSTFVNPIINPDTAPGTAAYDKAEPIRPWSTDSNSEVEIVIRAIPSTEATKPARRTS